MDTNKINEQFDDFLAEEELSISNAEMEKLLADVDIHDLDPHEDDAYLLDIIDPKATEDEKENEKEKDDHEELDEARVLSIPQRIKLSQRMRRLAKRYAILRKMRAKRMAPNERLRYRARKAALMMIRKRVAGRMAKKYNELSKQQRLQIDQMVARRFGKKLNKRVTMFANRLLPLIRKKEVARLAKARGGHPTTSTNLSAIQASYDPSLNEEDNVSIDDDFKRQFPDQPKGFSKTPTTTDHPVATMKNPLQKRGDVNKAGDDPHNLTDLSRHRKIYRKIVETVDEGRKSATTDQSDEGDTNIIYQLRKVINLHGNYEVQWADGTKSRLTMPQARHALEKYSQIMRTPGKSGRDKQIFVIRLGKNKNSFQSTLDEKEKKGKGFDTLRDNPPDLPPGSPYGQQTGYGMSPAAQGGALSYEGTNASMFFTEPEMSPLSHAAPLTPPEVDKEDDENPNDTDSRLSPKLDALLRLGLVKSKDLAKYRQALKSGEKGLMSPMYRKHLAGILDKLVKISTNDPQIYSRIRTDIVKSRNEAVANTRLMGLKRQKMNIASQIAREKYKIAQQAAAKAMKPKRRFIKSDFEIDQNAIEGLMKRSEKNQIPFETIVEVYIRGYIDSVNESNKEVKNQLAFNRVNAFIAGGDTGDDDLREHPNCGTPECCGQCDTAESVKKSPLQKLKDFDKTRVAVGKKPIFGPKQDVKQTIKETGGAGELGTDALRKKYSKDTPGQSEALLVAPYSVPKPTIDVKSVHERRQENSSNKSLKTFEQIKNQLSGRARASNVVEAVKQPTGDLKSACWKGYTAVGLKKKNGKMVPNCVPKEEVELDETIRKEGNKWVIYSKDGSKKLGTFDSETAAKKRLGQIEYFKHLKSSHEPKANDDLNESFVPGIFDAPLAHQYGITAQGAFAHHPNNIVEKEDVREITQRTLDYKMVKVRLPDGRIVFRKVKKPTAVQHEGCEECTNEESQLIEGNEYRVGSEKYFEYFNEKRRLYNEGLLQAEGFDKELLEGDIGTFAEYEGKIVPLDCPMIEMTEEDEKNPPIGKPHRGGPKKFYVYVRKPDGGVKKVTWGDTTGLSVKYNNPEARKSFAARHRCAQQKDRTSAAYWACNTPRYAKSLGLSGGGNFYW